MCNETKNVLLWHIMVLNCCVYHLMWPRMVLLLFTAMAMCGLIRLSMALSDHGRILPFCSLIWHFIVFYDRISSFIAVIDPNSFGLVYLNLSME